MRILCFLAISMLMVTGPLHAKLGDTVEQCVKRYGKPVGYSEASLKSPFGTLAFTAGPYTLIVFLLETKEVGARVTKADKSEFSEAEMKTIMEAEGDAALPWSAVTNTDSDSLEWTRDDKATVFYDRNSHMMIFTSMAMAAANKKAEQARAAAVGVGVAPDAETPAPAAKPDAAKPDAKAKH